MYATAEGTRRYIQRFPAYREAPFYCTVLGLEVSSLGIGTYLRAADDTADAAYIDALVAAAAHGINFFDTAINYRGQRSAPPLTAAEYDRLYLGDYKRL